MAKRFGGKYSPEGDTAQGTPPPVPGAPRGRARVTVDPAGARANMLFVPAVILVATSVLGAGSAIGMASGLLGALALTSAAWLLRGGLRAEAAFAARKTARRPAIPRKLFAAVLSGVGATLAVGAHTGFANPLSAVIYGLIAGGLHLAAFGLDPMRSKGMDGVDTFQQDRVARVVDEAEKHLTTMRQTIERARDREATGRLEQFVQTARDLIQTVEEDPRDLTAARKYLGVYLQGARDATAKFADIYARSRDPQAKADYLALLDDLDQNFAARNRKSLLADRSDLTVEIDVLRERLSREGVRLD
ncbi:5-bromo-4-chloroindolyl phosphate hydrolysis family protein [Sulfitobacter sp. S190]|uniref:5-bromo-4-chloroindolyl phosphate hydrolysis family protein n=1 Tax=Sulfitobacter sp. S190 TaxID=2867022 RepID=UPI0021A65201|nr:5-bromo-4-chloroindolyl phosphate hydrolysis family protein [Sulfitobacter sp. S190]UWR21559.1 5-bromo-4-chloroindolyl phosphate hydrolysis family protein [Sulfitobacter sp. S190]